MIIQFGEPTNNANITRDYYYTTFFPFLSNIYIYIYIYIYYIQREMCNNRVKIEGRIGRQKNKANV